MRRDTVSGSPSLFLADDGPLRPPPLRWEATEDGRRVLLRQGGRPVLLAESDAYGRAATVRRRSGYRSPLAPLRVDEARRAPDWRHRFADELVRSDRGPLHAGRWFVGRRAVFPPYVWRGDFVLDWPEARLEFDADGWNGVVPLRPPSAPDAPRVSAYRRQAREGVLPPVLLWWHRDFDGWLLLDGHDRAVAALAEGRDPEAVTLVRVPDEAALAREIAAVLDGAPPEADAGRLSEVVGSLPYDEIRNHTWPIPGGPAEWDAWMLEFRHEHD
ncbi:hypothetical protein [Streptomyces sp. NPDC051909]|uniref:hypothetical protein n=1 Tax=Streptomyces sp. NPDC051909 TaxID=3154944 RepID=UPI0034442271